MDEILGDCLVMAILYVVGMSVEPGTEVMVILLEMRG